VFSSLTSSLFSGASLLPPTFTSSFSSFFKGCFFDFPFFDFFFDLVDSFFAIFFSGVFFGSFFEPSSFLPSLTGFASSVGFFSSTFFGLSEDLVWIVLSGIGFFSTIFLSLDLLFDKDESFFASSNGAGAFSTFGGSTGGFGAVSLCSSGFGTEGIFWGGGC